jgi:hypothetical protein
LGTELPERVAGNAFLIHSLIMGSLSGFFCVRFLNRAKRQASASPVKRD